MLETILSQYGYPILLIGTFLEGETIMVLGGFSAHLGYLSLGKVIACGFFGTLFGDQLYFFIGRRHGKVLLTRHPAWHTRTDRVMQKLEKNQNLLIIGFRFLYGLRTVTPIVVGMSGVSYWRFTLLNILGAGIWATCFGLIGYYFGHAAKSMLGDIKQYELLIILSVIGLAIFVWLIHLTYTYRSTRK